MVVRVVSMLIKLAMSFEVAVPEESGGVEILSQRRAQPTATTAP